MTVTFSFVNENVTSIERQLSFRFGPRPLPRDKTENDVFLLPHYIYIFGDCRGSSLFQTSRTAATDFGFPNRDVIGGIVGSERSVRVHPAT